MASCMSQPRFADAPNPATPVNKAPYPVEGLTNFMFSNVYLVAFVLFFPTALVLGLGLPYSWFIPLLMITALPSFAVFIVGFSWFAQNPETRKMKLPKKPLEEYIKILDPQLKAKYNGNNNIPMEVFFENYFDGKIDLKVDCLELFEARYDWARFSFVIGQLKFFLTQWIPETLWHSRSQDEEQVRDHYERGNDFYEAFLGERMIYTSGNISKTEGGETLEQLQDNKLAHVAKLMGVKEGDRHLDIGCGWGTLVATWGRDYKTKSTGVTLARDQAEFGRKRIKDYGAKNVEIVVSDYRDMPAQKWDKITCLEMAEHVGILRFQKFLLQVKDMLDDDGLFYLQIAGLRCAWQVEDFIWGLFMAKYIFPGADASMPLYWVINQLECAGFEVKFVETVGVSYSATILRWYKNWMANKDRTTKKYGRRWFRIFEVFLAWSSIVARQGSATCYQIVAHKNRNSFDRLQLVNNCNNFTN